MKRSVLKLNLKKHLLLITVSMLSLSSFSQTEIPELVFRNPVLVSGTANMPGAVYRFSNVATEIDATIALMSFSSPSVVMKNIDNSTFGWDKAFQPEFGIPGNVPAYSDWWIDFRLTFYEAGSNDIVVVDKFSVSTIDVDGDGVSIQEYVKLMGASSVSYSSITYLTAPPPVIPTCKIDGKSSWSKVCDHCNGTGYDMKNGKKKKCKKCDGVGLVFAACDHPWRGADMEAQGPRENFANIDTLSTQVMATYVYNNISTFDFRYGAKSNAVVSNAGTRLNSMWFKSFNLAPAIVLPVKLESFTAVYAKKTVNLSWTAAEENFSHYVLQRSGDGKNFSDIALILTDGGAMRTNSYTYKDAIVGSATGSLFYRLQAVDKTKESTYSEVRVIRLGKETETLALQTYPNPATDQVRVTLPASWQGKAVSLELYSSTGTRIQNQKFSSASQTETMQLGSVSKGFYLVKASCGNEAAQQRVIKN